MVKDIIYPTYERIIEYNFLALTLLQVKKADKAEVLNHQAIKNVITDCRLHNGNLYDKAVCLLKDLVQVHAFASGNRRTAFIVTKDFVLTNNGKFSIKDDPTAARAMQGIRENYYKDEEIREWIMYGKIKEFKR